MKGFKDSISGPKQFIKETVFTSRFAECRKQDGQSEMVALPPLSEEERRNGNNMVPVQQVKSVVKRFILPYSATDNVKPQQSS